MKSKLSSTKANGKADDDFDPLAGGGEVMDQGFDTEAETYLDEPQARRKKDVVHPQIIQPYFLLCCSRYSLPLMVLSGRSLRLQGSSTRRSSPRAARS